MTNEFQVFEILLLIVILYRVIKLNRKVGEKFMAVEDTLNAVEARLDEASTEILAEIAKLKGEGLSPAAQATVGRLETKANALADIVPNATPEPPPA